MSEAKNIIEEHETLLGEVSSLKELLDEASEKIEKLTLETSEKSEELKKIQEEKTSLEEELDTKVSENEELEEQVRSLALEEDALEKKVSEKLNEIGVEPVSLQSEQEEFDHVKAWGEITDPIQKTNFYRQHKEKILGGLK
jgi:chromosome segregation ATPase